MPSWWITGRAGRANYRTEAFLRRRLARMREHKGDQKPKPLIDGNKPSDINGGTNRKP